MERRVLDRAALQRLRKEVGSGLPRLIAYFRDDGGRSVSALEKAIRAGNATALVLPAHTLKGDALQFGALPLGALAESIETAARRCVEMRSRPDALVSDILALRPLLDQTLAALAHEAGVETPAPAAAPAPVAAAAPMRPTFGRRTSRVEAG